MENNFFKAIREAKITKSSISELNRKLDEQKEEAQELLNETTNKLASGVVVMELDKSSFDIKIIFFKKIELLYDSITPEGYYALLASCFKDAEIAKAIAENEKSEELLQSMGSDYKFLWSMKNEAGGDRNE